MIHILKGWAEHALVGIPLALFGWVSHTPPLSTIGWVILWGALHEWMDGDWKSDAGQGEPKWNQGFLNGLWDTLAFTPAAIILWVLHA